MEATTLYDRMVQWGLNHPVISILVGICSILITIPKVRDGIVSVYRLFCPICNNKNNIIKYADETITVEEKLISQDFDIVKINATTHLLGVQAENEWLRKKYPGYENCMQMLTHIETKQGKKTFDVLPIKRGNIEKDIYFDITDFYEGASVSFSKNISDYAEKKISDIYQ